MIHVLIIEDEKELSQALCTFLISSGFNCTAKLNKFDAEDALIDFKYDLILLDINLPDGSGLELLRHLKKIGNNTPVLIISAKDSVDDKVAGLELGADDYIAKPFHMAELAARMKAILRRKKFDNLSRLKFNEIEIDTESMDVWIHGEIVEFTKTHIEILDLLISNANRLVTKEDMAARLWGEDPNLNDNFDFIYGHLRDMRKLITNAGGNDYIKTVYGAGYKFSNE